MCFPLKREAIWTFAVRATDLNFIGSIYFDAVSLQKLFDVVDSIRDERICTADMKRNVRGVNLDVIQGDSLPPPTMIILNFEVAIEGKQKTKISDWKGN